MSAGEHKPVAWTDQDKKHWMEIIGGPVEQINGLLRATLHLHGMQNVRKEGDKVSFTSNGLKFVVSLVCIEPESQEPLPT